VRTHAPSLLPPRCRPVDPVLRAAAFPDCDVYVLGPLRALRLRSLSAVRVFAFAVAGSAFVEGARSCQLHLAARQVRIHHTSDTDFYLRVRSRPVIEDTVRARFAPYAFCVGAREGRAENAAAARALAAAGLGEGDAAAWRDAWRSVDDFAWLRATPSPHWAELPAAERAAPPPPPPGEEETEDGAQGDAGGAAADDADEL
jgi:hypothetical protein